MKKKGLNTIKYYHIWGEKDKMKIENIYDIGKKLGLKKQDIQDIIKTGITCCAFAAIPIVSNISS